MVLGAPSHLQARPENIRPGVAYYDDAYVVKDGAPDLAGEKNFEEVYQFYAYFEARYDTEGRVVAFAAYKRGEVVWSAVLSYAPGGRLSDIRVTAADGASIPLPEP